MNNSHLNLPSNNGITISFSEYLQLIWDSRPQQIRIKNYAVISEERKHKIEAFPDFDKVVVIEQLSPEEIQELKNLNVIHMENRENRFFKLIKIDIWLASVQLEIERKMKRQAEIQELVAKSNRIQQAVTRMVSQFNLKYDTAQVMMQNFILPGKMMELAKMLEIDDLVKKD